jgi:hypothetical protein
MFASVIAFQDPSGGALAELWGSENGMMLTVVLAMSLALASPVKSQQPLAPTAFVSGDHGMFGLPF